MPPNRTTLPFAESYVIPEYARGVGARGGVAMDQELSPGMYSQVSPRLAPLYPPNRTTTPFRLSYAIAGPSRAPGPEGGNSFCQSVASFSRLTIAGAPVPMISTPFSVPALKSTSVSCVQRAACTFGSRITKVVKPSRTTIRTDTTRGHGDTVSTSPKWCTD